MRRDSGLPDLDHACMLHVCHKELGTRLQLRLRNMEETISYLL